MSDQRRVVELSRAGLSRGVIAALLGTTEQNIRDVGLGNDVLPGTAPTAQEQVMGPLRAGSEWVIAVNTSGGGVVTLQEMWEEPLDDTGAVIGEQVVRTDLSLNLATAPLTAGPGGTLLTLNFGVDVPYPGDGAQIVISDVDGTPGQPPTVVSADYAWPLTEPAPVAPMPIVQPLDAVTETDFGGLSAARILAVQIEGVLTPPDGSRDRIVLVRPNQDVLGGYGAVLSDAYLNGAGVAGGETAASGGGEGLVLASTGWQAESSIVANAVIQASVPAFPRRLCRSEIAATPSGADDARVLVGNVASYWKNNTDAIESLHFDFDGALFTGTIAVTPVE